MMAQRNSLMQPPSVQKTQKKGVDNVDTDKDATSVTSKSKMEGVQSEKEVDKTTDGDDFDSVAEKLILEASKEAYFHCYISKERVKDLLVNNGDFMVRTPERTYGEAVLSMRIGSEVEDIPLVFLKHGKDLKERLVTLNGNYLRSSVVVLIKDHLNKKIPVKKGSKVILGTPVLKISWELSKDILDKEVVIGEGVFGSVWSGKMKGSSKSDVTKVAIKETKITGDNKVSVEDMLSEAKMMKQLQHINVVTCFGIVLDAGQVMIVMELMNGGGLDRYLKKSKVSTQDKCSYCYDIANGLAYIHSKKIIHRDMAARNCLIDIQRNMVKISDFGMSKQVDQYKIKPTERTPIRWQAPEVVRTALYTKECDVYSYSMVMIEIFTDGKKPYDGIDNKTIRTKIQDATFRPPVPSSLPDDVKAVMMLSWSALPEQRTTMRFAAFTLQKYCKHGSPAKTSDSSVAESNIATATERSVFGKLPQEPSEKKKKEGKVKETPSKISSVHGAVADKSAKAQRKTKKPKKSKKKAE